MRNRALVWLVMLVVPFPGPVAAAIRAGASVGIGTTWYERKSGELLPLHAFFRDEKGESVELGRYFGKRPVVLVLAYYSCPDLCTFVLNGLADAIRGMPLRLGEDYDVVTVSVDPDERPPLALAKKRTYLARLGLVGNAVTPDGPWHFLTGRDAAIKALVTQAGFHYSYVPLTREYVHPGGLVILTPQGKVSRYLEGVKYDPRELRRALVEASQGKLGSLADRLFPWR